MDRVVCCYPAYEPMLHYAASHARMLLAMSYPRDRWHVRIMHAAENMLRWIRRNAFRAFVHPVTEMEAVLVNGGFTLISRTATLAWQMDVWRRSA